MVGSRTPGNLPRLQKGAAWSGFQPSQSPKETPARIGLRERKGSRPYRASIAQLPADSHRTPEDYGDASAFTIRAGELRP